MKKEKINVPKKALVKIINNIESVKIQGAENVAKASIKAFLLNPTKATSKKILSTRPTEPLMQNAIKLLLKSKTPKKTAEKFLRELEIAHSSIAKKGAALIKNDMNVYVHCHSSTVMDILKHAKRVRKKNFVVYTTEVEPLLQGHLTAKDLAKSKIKVMISPDMAAESAMKNCDLFLFGADAFTKNSVANKIGTSTLCRLAKIYNIPSYSAGVSKKFTKKIKLEKRSPKELWNTRNKRIKAQNPAFDKTPYNLITGIISEYGILSPKEFLRKAKSGSSKL